MRKKKNSNKPLEALATGYGLCMASKHITEDGFEIGYMYREEPEEAADSGWRFFSGAETDEFIENARNFHLVDVNKIANLDPDIIPLLNAPTGAVFDKVDGEFIDSSD